MQKAGFLKTRLMWSNMVEETGEPGGKPPTLDWLPLPGHMVEETGEPWGKPPTLDWLPLPAGGNRRTLGKTTNLGLATTTRWRKPENPGENHQPWIGYYYQVEETGEPWGKPPTLDWLPLPGHMHIPGGGNRRTQGENHQPWIGYHYPVTCIYLGSNSGRSKASVLPLRNSGP